MGLSATDPPSQSSARQSLSPGNELPALRLRHPAPSGALHRFDIAADHLAAALLPARTRFGELFPALSDDQRIAAAEAMPDLMRDILHAADDFIRALCLDADGFIGGVFSAYGRKAVGCVASAGWETESFDADFTDAAERLRCEAE
ncbi:MAG: hypothetical protein AB7U48_13465, partial [Bauldia sp.]